MRTEGSVRCAREERWRERERETKEHLTVIIEEGQKQKIYQQTKTASRQAPRRTMLRNASSVSRWYESWLWESGCIRVRR